MGCGIVIRGANFINKGGETMLRCVQHGIVARIPDAQALLDDWKEWSPEQLRGLSVRVGPHRRGGWRRLGATAVYHLTRLAPPHLRAAWSAAAAGVDLRVSALVDISGYVVGDHDFEGTAPGGRAGLKARVTRALLTDRDLFATAGIPFVYLPAVWGPLEKPAARAAADARLRDATRIYARDPETLQWLEGLPSFRAEKVALASDIAFTFEGASPETGRRLLAETGIRPEGPPLVGIMPNMRVYERTPGEGLDNLYLRRLVEVARHFAGTVGCQVAVLPHEIKLQPDGIPDDRHLCALIARAAADAGTVGAAVGDYAAEQLKAMIGELALLVSSRFHGLVAAMSLRVPVVSISWSHKYRQLMQGVGLGDYVVECGDLDRVPLAELCGQAWDERERMVRSLQEQVPQHEASARTVLDETVTLIRERMA